MNDIRLMNRIINALDTASKKAVHSSTLTVDALANSDTEITVTSFPVDTWFTKDWCIGNVLNFGNGIYRVVIDCNLSTKWLKVAAPLTGLSIGHGSTFSISSTPLAGADIYCGGGKDTDTNVVVNIVNVPESIHGIGRNYGSVEDVTSGTVTVRYSFVPSNSDTFKTGDEYMRVLAHQCKDVIQLGTTTDVFRIVYDSTSFRSAVDSTMDTKHWYVCDINWHCRGGV